MFLGSVFFLALLLPSFLSSKSVDSAWLPQGWSWEGWRLSTSNASKWMSVPDDVNEYFVKIEASFDKFVDQMKEDYTELSSEVRARVNKDMERLRGLKERVKEAMIEQREAVSSYDWSKRLNETRAVFDDIRVHWSSTSLKQIIFYLMVSWNFVPES